MKKLENCLSQVRGSGWSSQLCGELANGSQKTQYIMWMPNLFYFFDWATFSSIALCESQNGGTGRRYERRKNQGGEIGDETHQVVKWMFTHVCLNKGCTIASSSPIKPICPITPFDSNERLHADKGWVCTRKANLAFSDLRPHVCRAEQVSRMSRMTVSRAAVLCSSFDRKHLFVSLTHVCFPFLQTEEDYIPYPSVHEVQPMYTKLLCVLLLSSTKPHQIWQDLQNH